MNSPRDDGDGGRLGAVGGSIDAARRRVCVLVVDDDADIRESLAELLDELGYSVATAAHGLDALDVLRRVEPQLILLDLSMPIMSGAQFRAQQLADPAIAGIPTIVMTAADRAHDKTRGMEVEETLTKPIELRRLLDRLARHCGGG